MYAQPVESAPRSPAVPAPATETSQRVTRWARAREIDEAIVADGDPDRIVGRRASWSTCCGGLEEWERKPNWMRLVPMETLNDHQVALIYSLVPLALVEKTGSTGDRPGQPRYRDVRDCWLESTADELEEVRARLAEVWGPRLG
jgi:hypothetical protein